MKQEEQDELEKVFIGQASELFGLHAGTSPEKTRIRCNICGGEGTMENGFDTIEHKIGCRFHTHYDQHVMMLIQKMLEEERK